MSFIQFIVGYSEIEVASCSRMGDFGIFIKFIVGYSEVEVAPCHRIGRFNVFIVYCRI